MKHIFLSIFSFLVLTHAVWADNATTMTLNFEKEQFSFSKNAAGALEIGVQDASLMARYDERTDAPGLPWISVNVQVPLGTTIKDFSSSFSKNLLFEDIVIAENPIPLPTNVAFDLTAPTVLPQYKMSSFPTENVKYTTSSIKDGHLLLHFLVCPFVYDASFGKLHLINRLNLNICTQSDGIPTTREARREIFSQQFPCVIADSAALTPSYGSSIRKSLPSVYSDSIDYVVVTSDELAYYFNPWVQWKRTKGVRAKIVTVEEIMGISGTGFSKENAIKAYLSILYYNNGLKYVLLGGDDTVVPSKKCYGYLYVNGEKEEHKDIPTDMFYACLDYWHQDMFWDGNRNGINGELADSIDMSQLVAVTRLPVRTSTDVKTTLCKLMEYEQNPTKNGWNDNILTTGTRLQFASGTTQSDAEVMGDKLYQQFIAPYWEGTRKKYYDTFSDVDDTAMSKDGLQNQLSKGYNFVDIISHGGETAWGIFPNYVENCKASLYEAADAWNLSNTGYSVITTNACSTNAFDNSTDPCLSESFIRNMYSGVVAYLGSSRYGLYSYRSLDYSMKYESEFYKYLFSPSFYKEKNFGTIVAAAKAEMNGLCTGNAYRWLQFAINPIGDPETPIYTETPVGFSIAKATIFKNHVVKVDAGIDSCTICIMSSSDDGATYYEVRKNVQSVIFKNVKSDVSVCITKQNYVPKIFSLKQADATTYALIDDCLFDRNNGRLEITTKIDSSASNPTLMVSSASTGNTEKTFNISHEHPTVSADASTMENGVHIVSLFADGILVDSKSIIKK